MSKSSEIYKRIEEKSPLTSPSSIEWKKSNVGELLAEFLSNLGAEVRIDISKTEDGKFHWMVGKYERLMNSGTNRTIEDAKKSAMRFVNDCEIRGVL